ncbi:hypothetical protein WDU94_007011 [Cyamophila willieti]
MRYLWGPLAIKAEQESLKSLPSVEQIPAVKQERDYLVKRIKNYIYKTKQATHVQPKWETAAEEEAMKSIVVPNVEHLPAAKEEREGLIKRIKNYIYKKIKSATNGEMGTLVKDTVVQFGIQRGMDAVSNWLGDQQNGQSEEDDETPVRTHLQQQGMQRPHPQKMTQRDPVRQVSNVQKMVPKDASQKIVQKDPAQQLTHSEQMMQNQQQDIESGQLQHLALKDPLQVLQQVIKKGSFPQNIQETYLQQNSQQELLNQATGLHQTNQKEEVEKPATPDGWIVLASVLLVLALSSADGFNPHENFYSLATGPEPQREAVGSERLDRSRRAIIPNSTEEDYYNQMRDKLIDEAPGTVLSGVRSTWRKFFDKASTTTELSHETESTDIDLRNYSDDEFDEDTPKNLQRTTEEFPLDEYTTGRDHNQNLDSSYVDGHDSFTEKEHEPVPATKSSWWFRKATSATAQTPTVEEDHEPKSFWNRWFRKATTTTTTTPPPRIDEDHKKSIWSGLGSTWRRLFGKTTTTHIPTTEAPFPRPKIKEYFRRNVEAYESGREPCKTASEITDYLEDYYDLKNSTPGNTHRTNEKPLKFKLNHTTHNVNAMEAATITTTTHKVSLTATHPALTTTERTTTEYEYYYNLYQHIDSLEDQFEEKHTTINQPEPATTALHEHKISSIQKTTTSTTHNVPLTTYKDAFTRTTESLTTEDFYKQYYNHEEALKDPTKWRNNGTHNIPVEQIVDKETDTEKDGVPLTTYKDAFTTESLTTEDFYKQYYNHEEALKDPTKWRNNGTHNIPVEQIAHKETVTEKDKLVDEHRPVTNHYLDPSKHYTGKGQAQHLRIIMVI